MPLIFLFQRIQKVSHAVNGAKNTIQISLAQSAQLLLGGKYLMTIIELYSFECKSCGHIMLMKPTMLSYNSLAPPPEDMDLSDKCDECGSGNLKSISEEEGLEKIKSKAGE